MSQANRPNGTTPPGALPAFRACAWPVASLSQHDLELVLAAANSHGEGAACVATCQRIEVFHLEHCECGAPERFAGVDALQRLAEVAAGLHSLVLGEEQVLGQVRSAIAAASEDVAEQAAVAIAAARALRAETPFNAHTGHLLDRALRVTGVEPTGRVAIVGAGAVGRLVAERAAALGFKEIVIAARREPDARWFAPPMRYEHLTNLHALEPVDVLVTCLGSTAEPLLAAEIPEVRSLVVDLGTPRNVAGDLHVPVITIADMLASNHHHADSRRAVLRERLRELLRHRLEMEQRDSASLPGRFRLEVERIRRNEAERISRLHPDVSEQTVEAITRSLVNHLFHRPTERLRTISDPRLGELLVELFAADPAMETHP